MKTNYYNLLNVAYKEILKIYHLYKKDTEYVLLSDCQVFVRAMVTFTNEQKFDFTEKEENLLIEKFKNRFTKSIGFKTIFEKVKEIFESQEKPSIEKLSHYEPKNNFYKAIKIFDDENKYYFTEDEKNELWNEYCLQAIIKDKEIFLCD